MNLVFHDSFKKSYKKLPRKHQLKTNEAILKFQQNPLNPTLKNHRLAGRMIGKRAFCVMGDLRVIFKEYEKYTLVLMLNVGTHNQVY